MNKPCIVISTHDDINILGIFEKYQSKDVEMIFTFLQYDDFTAARMMIFLKSLKLFGYRISIMVETTLRYFNDDSVKNLLKVQKAIKQKIKLIGKDKGSLEQYQNNKKELDEFIKDIWDKDISPLERFLCIYHYVGNLEVELDVRYKRKDITSFINGDMVISFGASELVLYLSQKLGIRVFPQRLDTAFQSFNLMHDNNLVYLEDDKYDIHGLYYADVTWDRNKEERMTYAFALIPLKNIYNMKNCTVKHLDDACLLYEGEDHFMKMISLDYSSFKFGRTKYFEGNDYSNLLVFYHLTEGFSKSEENYIEAIKNGNERLNKAVDRLRGYLKEGKIIDGIYDSRRFVPYGTSINVLLGLTYFDLDEVVKNNIKLLDEYYSSYNMGNKDEYVHCSHVSIDYYLNHLEEDENAKQLANTMNKISYYLLLNEINKEYRDNNGKVIPLEKYQEALEVVYRVFNEEEYLEEDIKNTISYSRKTFKDKSLVTFK